MNKVFIIAEAGVNHNGDVNLAKSLVNAAVEAGADAVKFQTWKTELLLTKDAEQAGYQRENTKIVESQYDMLKKLELSYPDFIELKGYCDKKKIIFMSTPDEIESATFLAGLQDVFKIGSGEITNLPFLQFIGQLGKEVVLSSGMADMGDIEDALNILTLAGTPLSQITVLHATTEYPCPIEDVNLSAMLTIRNAFHVKVGYSDHTTGIEVPIAAASIGATIIEKHFTLDRTLAGPDHKASLEPDELRTMVEAIRNVEIFMGNGIKRPNCSEVRNIPVVRKSIVAAVPILKGEVFTADKLNTKRPGNGISPMRWEEVVGRKASRDFLVDEFIEL